MARPLRTPSGACRRPWGPAALVPLVLLCLIVNADAAELRGDQEDIGSLVDWESLVQTGEDAQKLHVTGNAKVDAVLEVGDRLDVKGTIKAKTAEFEEGMTVRAKQFTAGGAEFILGTHDGLEQLSRKQNRALSHRETPVDSLHINFQGDFEGGVVVGGPSTTVQGDLVTNGQLKSTSRKPLELATDTIILGKKDGKTASGAGSSNRALFHSNEPKDSLVLNKEGDFDGGTVVEGKALMTKGKLGVGTTEPQGDVHVVSNGVESEASVLLGLQPGNQAVFLKAKAEEGGTVGMELGATAGNPDASLRVNFPGAVDFTGPAECEAKGMCKTVFSRGDTLFTTGRVGIGAQATNLEHGITVEGRGPPGAPEHDVLLSKGSLKVFGAIHDVSSKDGSSWFLDMDKGGRVKGLNVMSKLGVGTDQPQSVYGDTRDGLLHVADEQHPVAVLESLKGEAASLVFKAGKSQFQVQQKAETLSVGSGEKTFLTLDAQGKLGLGGKNEGPYGVSVGASNEDESPLNDLSIPNGNLRLKGKVLDTFDGGDAFYLDLSQGSNLQDLNVAGKLSLGVKEPKFDVELQEGSRHIALGRSLFLNGFGGETAYVTNNAYLVHDGGYHLEDKSKMASAIELKNNGRIELRATKEAGKLDWSTLFGIDATQDAVFANGKLGVGVEKPEHALHVAGGDAQISLGNNMFINGQGSTNVISANAYIRKEQWMIQRKDRFATSIHLKDDGRLDMYGTTAQGSAEWNKMLGFNSPKKTVYAFGKFGLNTENPSHTLTLPSGDHHISLGNNLFLNGAGALTRIMGNSYMKLGQYTVANEHHHGLSMELDSATSRIEFGGSQTKGSNKLLKLLSMDFLKKSVSLPSGRFGIKTGTPKVSLDVRGHLNLQDPSQAAVMYAPASGAGFFLRVSDTPGKYDKSQERYFFGSNARAGFGTTAPEATLHLTQSKEQEALPILTAQTESGDRLELSGDKARFTFKARQAGWINFEHESVKPLQMYLNPEEESVNNVKVSKTLVMLAASGGRVGIGDAEPKSEHSLQVTGPGILVASDEGSSGGVVAFANDGGGDGFQMDYNQGKMKLGSLPPTSHLQKKSKQQTYMTFTDGGKVGIGTESPEASLTVKSESGVKLENKEGASWRYSVAKDGALEFSSNQGGFFAIDSQGGFHLNKHKKSEYKFEVSGKGLRLAGDENGQAPILFAADMGGKGFRMDYSAEKMIFGHEDGKKTHMVIDDAGMVGMGTDNPMGGLHVKHEKGIAIEQGGGKLSRWNVHASKDTAALVFGFMDSPKVTFTHKGYVGIGTQDPKRMLHVEGDMWVGGRLHVDNWFAKKAKERSSGAQKPAAVVHELGETQALLELDEHTSGKVDDSYGTVDADSNPADYTKMMALMHKVIQSHTKEIRELKARLAKLEK